MMTVGLPVKHVDKSLQLLKELIAVDSVNPSLVAGAAGEAAVARTIAEAMRGMGLIVETQDVAPGRPNIIGTLNGAIIGAAAFLLTEEWLSGLTEHWKVIFGPLLVLVAVFAPGGLIGLFAKLRRMFRG